MQVFKTALRIFFKHPIYIAIYIIFLSCMGVFIGMSNAASPQADFVEVRPDVAIIDRDGSTFSQGLSDFVAEHATIIEIEDSRLAMQDATAQNLTKYIMIIPENFGEDFMAAATSGSTAPELETMVSYESIAANMMNGLVNEYLNTSTFYLSSGTATTQAEAIDFTSTDMVHAAEATMVSIGDSAPISKQWLLYMQFSSYTIMLSIAVCVGVVMSAFNRTELRRRDLTSPISPLSMNLQITAAAGVIMLITWAWASLLGLVVFGSSLSGVNPAIIALVLLSLLAYCTFPLALGFFLGQLATSEVVTNAVGNITGLVVSFIGGIWVPLDVMSQAVRNLAYFSPTFYYGEAITLAVDLHEFNAASLQPIFTDLGIILLFSLAIFVLALVTNRLRMQSSDAGGNAAAEQARS